MEQMNDIKKTEPTTAEEMTEQVEAKAKGKKLKNVSTTKKIVTTAIFSTLAFLTSYFEIPLFPAAGFLKLDFSAVFILLCGFMFGAGYGVTACAIKELLCCFKTSTGYVGELANFVVISAFILIPSIVYQHKKGLTSVIVTLIIASVVQIGLSLLANRFINFPLFMGDGAKEAFHSLWGFIVAFNAIKSVTISLITILLYKRISTLIKAI